MIIRDEDKKNIFKEFFMNTQYDHCKNIVTITHNNITLTFDIKKRKYPDNNPITDEDFFILIISIVAQYNMATALVGDRYFRWCRGHIEDLTEQNFADFDYMKKLYNIFCVLYGEDNLRKMHQYYKNKYRHFFYIKKDIIQLAK